MVEHKETRFVQVHGQDSTSHSTVVASCKLQLLFEKSSDEKPKRHSKIY